MGDQGKGPRISETGMGQTSTGDQPAAQRPRASTHLECVKCRETTGGGQRWRGGDRDLHVLSCEILPGLWLLLRARRGHRRLSR